MRHALVRSALVIVTALLAFAPRANAQDGFGLHGGGTIDPDQGFFGMHYVSRPLSGDLRVTPSADVGFGNSVVLSAFHVDFAQWFDIGPRWNLYFGGGPVVNVYRFELGGGDDTETDVEGGFDTVIGFAHRSGMTFEMRVGASGSPDLRFMAGYTFR